VRRAARALATRSRAPGGAARPDGRRPLPLFPHPRAQPSAGALTPTSAPPCPAPPRPSCVLNLSPEKERCLREVYRVLAPGGEMFFSGGQGQEFGRGGAQEGGWKRGAGAAQLRAGGLD
jgi:hypothetical protein